MKKRTTARKKAKRSAPVIVDSISDALDAAGDRLAAARSSANKKNYAQNLSNALARIVADALRHYFPGILPDHKGGFESRARTAKGFKKLDVNYSTLDLGLALGVSIKSVNFPEGKGANYAKNVTRVDNELRAEAEDYHVRQPFAYLVALYFVPVEATANANKRKPSSFGHMVKILRNRALRQLPTDSPSLFEKIYIGLYEPEGLKRGQVLFFDVACTPPWEGFPSGTRSFAQILDEARTGFIARNRTEFTWEDVGVTEDDTSTAADEALGEKNDEPDAAP